MRISCTYRSKEKEWGSSHSEVIIGRSRIDPAGLSISHLIVPFLDYTLAFGRPMAATGSKTLIAPVEQTGRCRNQITEPQRISDGERYLGWAKSLSPSI